MHGHADGNRKPRRAGEVPVLGHLGHAGPQTLGHHGGLGGARVGHEHHELVAAEAGQEVVGPDASGHGPGHVAQHGVSGFVAVGVVDGLEMFQVAKEQGGGDAPAFGQAQQRRSVPAQVGPVGNPGQFVGVAFPGQLLVNLDVEQITGQNLAEMFQEIRAFVSGVAVGIRIGHSQGADGAFGVVLVGQGRDEARALQQTGTARLHRFVEEEPGPGQGGKAADVDRACGMDAGQGGENAFQGFARAAGETGRNEVREVLAGQQAGQGAHPHGPGQGREHVRQFGQMAQAPGQREGGAKGGEGLVVGLEDVLEPGNLPREAVGAFVQAGRFRGMEALLREHVRPLPAGAFHVRQQFRDEPTEVRLPAVRQETFQLQGLCGQSGVVERAFHGDTTTAGPIMMLRHPGSIFGNGQQAMPQRPPRRVRTVGRTGEGV